MACLASPRLQHLPQRKNDIKLATSDLAHGASKPARPSWDLHDSASIVSTPSIRSCNSPHPKDQILRCLQHYTTLAQNTLTKDTAQDAALWCCLGLAAAVHASGTSPQAQSPLSAESRTGSNHSLATASDSGFASVETQQRHYLSLGDPEIEHAMTNLVCGLTGTFTSNLVDLEGATCSFPVGVGHEFDNALSQLELGKQENADVLLLANKASAQLLDLIQNQDGTSGFSAVNYWELCLSLVVACISKDALAVDSLTDKLQSTIPPPSLTEPALSSLLPPSSRARQLGNAVPFPVLEPNSKLPHVPAHLRRQTRSRAASLMSHSSLRSFSSVRSLGNFSPKSPASLSLSLSHDLRFSESPIDELSPSGSFVTGSPETGLGSLGHLSRILHANLRRGAVRRATISGDEYPSSAPTSPLRPTHPPFSRSASGSSELSSPGASILFSGNPKPSAKGKEKAQFGLRPGAAGVSSRTGTRFVMTSPPTPSGLGHGKALPKLDPVLAALERSSKLKSKSLCANCATRGSNYPCCPRCGETWCSRECRVAANNGGKHTCKRVASPSL